MRFAGAFGSGRGRERQDRVGSPRERPPAAEPAEPDEERTSGTTEHHSPGVSARCLAVTGVGELTGSSGWLTAAGWVGVTLGLIASYAALAFELEDVRHRTVLPVGRRGEGADTMTGDADTELASLVHEAGVRTQL